MMRGIRGKDTHPELVVRSFLHRAGFRYRLHARDLPGSPDIVLPRWNAVIFVHGCFWHQHKGCPKSTLPSSNRRFWQAKFAANTARDLRNLRHLRRLGWRTKVVWECALAPGRLNQVVSWIRSER